MKKVESTKEFGGFLERYQHASKSCQCDMTFSVYLPPQAANQKVPVLYWLSGLTCTDDNARTKAGMQRYAAEHGLAIVFPDTSPRGVDVADQPERYDLGQGAGFYVNATQSPWAEHYQMYDYVTKELPELVETHFSVSASKSISGHSMGGHGALICALKNPDAYASVSAFAPICHPTQGAWGKGCFSAYLGDNVEQWQQYDATELILAGAQCSTLLIDQGDADEFYDEQQLLPEHIAAAGEKMGQPVKLRLQSGYDHSYHFIASFIGEHMAFHAQALKA